MTLEELKDTCEKAIGAYQRINFPGKPKITLLLPESKAAPKKRRLFGKSGPLGDVVAWGFDGFDTVIFDAQEALEYINGIMSRELEGEK
jgi:hypothetical protein